MLRWKWNGLILAVAVGGSLLPEWWSDGTAAADWRWWHRQPAVVDPTPGVRQKEYKGQLWPPQPRPVTPKARLIDQYHYAHYWPYPLTCQDRGSIYAMLAAQAANGWVAETTLYDQHFDAETNTLNEAGRMQLRWILLHAPPEYRAAFVAATDDPQASQVRLASVQGVATEMTGPDNLPRIELRTTQQLGTSAQDMDLIRRKWISTIPTPRIPYKSVIGGTTPAGGGGAAGTGGQ
jgi:hypothetical protein